MTRDLDWGVPVPVEGAEGKVLYVWLDAPIGYITATMEWCEARGQDWKDWWQDPNAELLHFIGKDNIVFHCIIFPILLKEHGGYNLPTNVPANEFMNLEGDKISTSRNWAVWVTEYLEDFPEGVSRELIIADNFFSSCRNNTLDVDVGRTDSRPEKINEGQRSFVIERNHFTKQYSTRSSNASASFCCMSALCSASF